MTKFIKSIGEWWKKFNDRRKDLEGRKEFDRGFKWACEEINDHMMTPYDIVELMNPAASPFAKGAVRAARLMGGDD